jgi:hypothetical protein
MGMAKRPGHAVACAARSRHGSPLTAKDEFQPSVDSVRRRLVMVTAKERSGRRASLKDIGPDNAVS